jgi:nicotinamide riboside transporter PnuC
MKIEIISFIAMILSVVGVLANNRKMKICFILWIISNVLTGFIHQYDHLYSLAVRDAIFTVLAVEGWIRWSGKLKVNS